ncbi:MAG: alpha/beta fold hydrolase [Deltaproteobacteria bacterium]|nr:alpha/beta fold hydrolase [Candidatus Zymogenaceae bacterium]
MDVIRTPDERFENISDFPYTPNYIDVGGLRVHYVDEGAGETIMCLHGEPTWSYLYRKIIAGLSDTYRIIAPDFIGFGRSDKLSREADYTFLLHLNTLEGFIGDLGLSDVTLVVHDWGGMIGLRFAVLHEEVVRRLVILNTGLPTGKKPGKAFLEWQNFVRNTPDLPIDLVMQMGVHDKSLLTDEVMAAYLAPFFDAASKAGARAWPLMVPVEEDQPAAEHNRDTRERLKTWKKPALVMFSDKDPISVGADEFFRKLIPTAKDQPAVTIADAGHFLQEEKGEEIAERIREFMART